MQCINCNRQLNHDGYFLSLQVSDNGKKKYYKFCNLNCIHIWHQKDLEMDEFN